MFHWPGDLDEKPVTNYKKRIVRNVNQEIKRLSFNNQMNKLLMLTH